MDEDRDVHVNMPTLVIKQVHSNWIIKVHSVMERNTYTIGEGFHSRRVRRTKP